MAAIIGETKSSSEIQALLKNASGSLFKKGDAEAQCKLGNAFAEGNGVVQDLKQAVEWHHKAAKQGYMESQFKLGMMYANGEAVPRNFDTACMWLRKAANQKHEGAELAILAIRGNAVFADREKVADAQFKLGLKYEEGEEVPQSNQIASEWFQKAATQGNAHAIQALNDIKQLERAIRSIKDGDTTVSLSLYYSIGLKGTQAKKIFGMLEAHKTLQRLYLNVRIEAARIIAFAQVLETNNTLLDLNLNYSRIDDAGAIALAKALEINKTLQILNLSGNLIGDAGAVSLAKSMQINKTLMYLFLGQNKIGAAGVAALVKMLEINKTLQTIDLHSAEIGAFGIIALAKMLETNNTLKDLRLYNTQIGDDGAIALAKVLEVNKTLQKLVLNSNEIGAAGTIVLAKALESHKTLQELELCGNKIDDAGAIALAKALEANKTLQKLELWGNQIGDAGGTALAKMLEKNKTLQHLSLGARYLGGNQIGDAGATALLKVLDINKTLQNLELDQDAISKDIIARIKRALGRDWELEEESSSTTSLEVKKQKEAAEPLLLPGMGTIGGGAGPLFPSYKEITVAPNLLATSVKRSVIPTSVGVRGSEEVLALQEKAEIGNADAQFNLGMRLVTGRGVLIDDALACEWFRKAAEQGHADSQLCLGEAFRLGNGVPQDIEQARNWFLKAAAQGNVDAKTSLESLPLSAMVETEKVKEQADVMTGIPTSKSKFGDDGSFDVLSEKNKIKETADPLFAPSMETMSGGAGPHAVQLWDTFDFPITQPTPAAETKVSQEVATLTAEQVKFITSLQTQFAPQVQQQLKLLSQEEFNIFKDWSEKVSKLEAAMSETQNTLALDAATKEEQEYINAEPKLKNYQHRLQMELNRFILCYFLAPAGIFKLNENKKDLVISAIGGIPMGGQFLKVLTTVLSAANKQYRFYQINRVSELFTSTEEISHILLTFARRLTLAKETTILQQKEIQYEGFYKIKGFYQMVKEALEHQWKDLVKSDKTGVTLPPEDKLAVLDCAYLLQQIMSGEALIDKTKDIPAQFIPIITGEPYKPRVLPILESSVFVSTVASPTIMASVKVTSVQAPELSRVSSTEIMDVKAMMRKLKEQEEALKKQREEFETHRKAQEEEARKQREKTEAAEAETKSLAEKLERVQKQLPKPTTVDGGAEALALATPTSIGLNASSFVSYAEFLAMREQVSLVTQTVASTTERVEMVSETVYKLQDQSKIDRSKAGERRMKLSQFEASAEKRKQEIAEIEKAQSKTKKATGIDALI